MYNQWALQQVIAMQLQQQHIMNMMPPMPPMQNEVNCVSDDDDDDEDDEDARTLFVGNLDDRVTDELLYEVFLQAGPIESVRIPKDNMGRQRSFGFVTYMHQCTPPYAIQLYQGLALFRKSLTIQQQGSANSKSHAGQRRSLPSDCEVYQRRSGGGGGSGNNSFDNGSLRGNRSFDSSMRGGNSDLSPDNPFKQNDRMDWTHRRNAKDRLGKHSSSQSRPHHNSTPYERRSGGDSYDRDHRRNYHNSGSNRRSEQRSSRR